MSSQSLGAVNADVQNEDLARTRSVVEEATNAMSLLQAVVETSKCKDGELQELFEKMLKDAVTPMQHSLLETLHKGVSKLVSLLERAMHQQSNLLSQIAGGAAHGCDWHSTRPAEMPILDWYEKTLKNVATKQLQEHIDRTEVALEELQALPKAYTKLLNQEPFEQAGVQHSAAKVRACLARAQGTKAEWFLCATLAKPDSSKFMDRLSTYTSDLQSALKDGQMWDTVVHKDVAELVKAGLSKAPSGGKKRSSSASVASVDTRSTKHRAAGA